MNVLFTILTVLVLLASALLTLIVLLQNGKGGGLASNFVAGNQTFGVRQTADILEKITWGLVAFVGIGAILISSSLPITGSNFPCAALSLRFTANLLRFSNLSADIITHV